MVIIFTGDITTLITCDIKPNTRKRYTSCTECEYELHSPNHEKQHLLWQMKYSNPKKSKIVEVVIDGVLHRGMVYPVEKVEVL